MILKKGDFPLLPVLPDFHEESTDSVFYDVNTFKEVWMMIKKKKKKKELKQQSNFI